MSDINKIVAAILSTGRFAAATATVTTEARIEEYHRCLALLGGEGDKAEATGPDLNAIKTAIVETLDRVLAKR